MPLGRYGFSQELGDADSIHTVQGPVADQRFGRRVALEMISDRMTYLQSNRRTVAVRELEFTGHCCTFHARHPSFPCCHLLRDPFGQHPDALLIPHFRLDDFLRTDFPGAPMLTLSDIPRR
jgi:hypothetical protein